MSKIGLGSLLGRGAMDWDLMLYLISQDLGSQEVKVVMRPFDDLVWWLNAWWATPLGRQARHPNYLGDIETGNYS